jgi:hypothetical protein
MILTPYAFVAAGGGWRTIWDWVAVASGLNSGWGGYTLRQRAIASSLGGAGSKVRATCMALVGGTVAKAYVQVAAASGDPYDFDSTPVALTFDGGSTSVTIANATPKLSDEVNVTFDGTRALVFSFYFSSMGNIYAMDGGQTGRTNSVEGYHFGDDAATVDAASGYTFTNAAFIAKLEVFS